MSPFPSAVGSQDGEGRERVQGSLGEHPQLSVPEHQVWSEAAGNVSTSSRGS